ncbi:hypothetical protein PJV92_12080 [Aliarcobacter butzleri]|uniref:Uncharacterized protein n=2 Tax=Aliarcobacter butzleri TaxID=28197 RepID=A0AAP4Q0T1_9BACT|nr:hypothetical protein [Aliarcobacter butzleri]MDN5053227.1 hypothetical protein [Aliarcobacter butzleri]MDN5117663.1 hypothetical protein [Aliarcobacter butzleri]MDN5133457.1 hypothetical protein [Aliarcobacter butzleri]
MILLIIDLLQKFDYRIDETNIKKFLKALQKIEEHQHQIFLEDLQKTLQYFDEQKKLQEQNFLNELRDKENDRLHISEYSDRNAGVQPDTFAMRFSRV